MLRMKIIIVFFFSLTFFSFSHGALAFVTLDSDFTEDTTLTSAEGPYYIGSCIRVANGVTLIVEPGAVLKFGGSYSLAVDGELRVNGTEVEPVYFTSFNDDEIGGDTNGNGSTTSPTPRDWRGLSFASGSIGNLENIVVKYGGYRRSGVKPSPGIYNNGGDVTISNSLVTLNNHTGIGQRSGSLSITNTTISNQDFYGLLFVGGSLSISDSSIEGHNREAIVARGVDSVALYNNDFINNSTAVDIDISNAPTILHEGNTATGGYHHGIVMRGFLEEDLSLSHGSLPYIISGAGGSDFSGSISFTSDNNLAISETGSLDFAPGSIVKFSGNGSELNVQGVLNALGTEASPIYFTSLRDNTVGNENGDGASPSPSDWKHISLSSGGSINLDYAKIKYAGSSSSGGSRAGIRNSGGSLTISNTEITDNKQYGIYHNGGTTNISNSLITNSDLYGVFNNTTNEVDARNNDWGHETGPYHETLNPSGQGIRVSDYVLFEPWGVGCGDSCASNVMFLPGIMSSRLYANGEQLWEAGEDEVDDLYLDSNGKTINQNVYTKDVIDTFDAVLNVDIYDSFIDSMEDLVVAGEINNFAAVPYDWRLSLPDILNSGKEDVDGRIFFNQATSTPYIEQTLRELAMDSKSGKVTIVTHSNGGLLAKALINELGPEASNLIDKLIMVGVPQLGTPKAVGSLLNGYTAGISFQVSNEKARDFSINAPMIYQLLPQSDYYQNAGVSISTPLVRFESGSMTDGLVNIYGNTIDNHNEFKNFVLGADGRSVPDYNDLSNAAIGNASLFGNSENLLSQIGSNWSPPEGVEVHQIAGVGEQTVAGLTYKTIKKCEINILVKCLKTRDEIAVVPEFTTDGDGTVVEPSALLMSDGDESVSRWWVNLKDFNDKKLLDAAPFRSKHARILSVPEDINFVSDLVLDGDITASEYDYISEDRPDLENQLKMSFVLHSPLNISLLDAEGNVVDKNNPDSLFASFERYGETQIIHVFDDKPFTINLDGYETGSFTLEVKSYDEGEVIEQTVFSAVPNSIDTTAVMEFSGASFSEASPLKVDYDNDGEVDVELEPVDKEEVTVPPPTTSELIQYFKNYVNENIEDKKVRKQLIKEIDQYYKQVQKQSDISSKFGGFSSWLKPFLPGNNVYLISLRTKIKVYARMGRINQDDYKVLVDLLEYIENP